MSLMKVVLTAVFVFVAAVPALADTVDYDLIRDLQAVDADGVATHDKVARDGWDAPPTDENRVVVKGIALNRSEDYLDPDLMFQLHVQAVDEGPGHDDAGGIAVWSGAFFKGGPGSDDWLAEFDRMNESGFQPGDLVQVEGFCLFRQGKTMINERHSDAPQMRFTISVLEAGVGMPEPNLIPDLAEATVFDQSRESGGELYQTTWSKIQNVWIDDQDPGEWGTGETVWVTDETGTRFPLDLSPMYDFDSYSAPIGMFSVTGVFNQEDPDSPYHHGYRLLVKDYSYFELDYAVPIPEPTGGLLLVLGIGAAVGTRRRRRM